jgi:ATP-dependent Clp endopeptidase proteolytic subunit ClpP
MPKMLFDAALLAQAKDVLARRSAFNFVAKTAAHASGDRSWYRIAQAAMGAADTDVFIYSEIGFFGISADQFIRDLAAINTQKINLHINSPGGSVFDGIAIYNSLIQHPASITAYVDGWAASIASVIMCAADEIQIGEAAQVMIHQPWSLVMGPAADMRAEADVLDKIEQAIIGVYAARTGGDVAEIAAQMAAETWFLGQEAVDAGFADECMPNKKPKKKMPDDPMMPDAKALPAATMDAEFFAVIFPHLPEQVRANLAAVPQADQPFDFDAASRADFEKLLRAAGCSGKRAKAITNTGFKPSTERPADAKTDEEPTATDRPGDAVRRAATVAAILNATRAFPHL